jgi:hypothetical protein
VPWKARNWGTFRDEGKVLPSRAARVEWVVVPVPIPDPGEQAVFDQYVKPAFREVYRADNVLVLRRR